jgi:hypothetical protein
MGPRLLVFDPLRSGCCSRPKRHLRARAELASRRAHARSILGLAETRASEPPHGSGTPARASSQRPATREISSHRGGGRLAPAHAGARRKRRSSRPLRRGPRCRRRADRFECPCERRSGGVTGRAGELRASIVRVSDDRGGVTSAVGELDASIVRVSNQADRLSNRSVRVRSDRWDAIATRAAAPSSAIADPAAGAAGPSSARAEPAARGADTARIVRVSNDPIRVSKRRSGSSNRRSRRRHARSA